VVQVALALLNSAAGIDVYPAHAFNELGWCGVYVMWFHRVQVQEKRAASCLRNELFYGNCQGILLSIDGIEILKSPIEPGTSSDVRVRDNRTGEIA